MAANVNISTFTIFNNLPHELRLLIWEYALPEDIPEVCIPWPLEEVKLSYGPNTSSHIPTSQQPTYLPFLVDTGFPKLMHVCHESREVTISHTRFRYSPIAGCPVPFRAFRPDLDILYITVCRSPGGEDIGPRWGVYPPGTRHIALDLHSIKDGTELWRLLGHPDLDVRTLRCVLPAIDRTALTTGDRFRPPVRRCRLGIEVNPPAESQNSYGEYGNAVFVDHGFDNKVMVGLGQYFENIQENAGLDPSEFTWDPFTTIPPEYRRRWDPERKRYDVEFHLQAFVEWRGKEWVLSSEHLVCFEHQFNEAIPPYSIIKFNEIEPYRVSEEEMWTPLRNPEMFRVNDIQQNEVPVEWR
ncbi:uncharacterized protein F4822DRAFT_325203 [Hypoxylon trugodes]|uniref:uncharacterized protein n=1 Tax=Hypoxylon trugodes TaxID=326681 RepID=UPI0021A22B01|nr:uncharacterized protein F4822DRAFT_325203 [Hypoxylon trugodes]KAI1386724.1 hypothetical protein F4822DRAFT_325203 [Hypoxylon trugodes]